MNILFISKYGDGWGLAGKLAEEGHTVRFWIKDVKCQNRGKGFKNPERVFSYQPFLRRSDVIIFDMSGMGSLFDSMRKVNLPVLGASSIADKLEEDRAYAQSIVKQYAKNVDIPMFKEFNNIEQGVKFLERQKDKMFCFKPDKMSASMTFIPRKDNASVITHMRGVAKKAKQFILQEKVDGIEISTEGWLDKNGEWVEDAFNHTMEEKRFLSHGWGDNCGCSGSVVWKCGRDKLVETVILPFTELLAEAGHIGPFDVNVLVNKDKVHFLEFSLRFGYDAIENLAALMENKAEFFKAVATGEGNIQVNDGLSMAVRLSMPPYPFTEGDEHSFLAKENMGLMPVDVPDDLKSHVYLADVMMEKGKPVMAGCDNVIGTVVATAETIDDCRDIIFDEEHGIISEIAQSHNIQFRHDIGEGMDEEIKILQKESWLEKNND